MKFRIFTILLLFVSLNVSGQAVLLDKTTGQCISYAQILNNKGAVVGTTDIEGNLPQDLNDEVVTIHILPITLRMSNHLYLRKILLFI